MTQTWDPAYIAILVPSFAAIILAIGYLARRVLDNAGTRDVPIRGAAIISSEAMREVTHALEALVDAHERGTKAHERHAAAAEALLAAQKDQIRLAAAARQASEIDELKRQVADLTRELARDRSAPTKRS